MDRCISKYPKMRELIYRVSHIKCPALHIKLGLDISQNCYQKFVTFVPYSIGTKVTNVTNFGNNFDLCLGLPSFMCRARLGMWYDSCGIRIKCTLCALYKNSILSVWFLEISHLYLLHDIYIVFLIFFFQWRYLYSNHRIEIERS